MPYELVTLDAHIVKQRGLPFRLPQDRILYGGRLIGYVGTQKNAGINLIVYGLPDSIKHQVKLVVAERDAELFGTSKLEVYERRISEVPKPIEDTQE